MPNEKRLFRIYQIIWRSVWSKSKDQGRRISRRFSIAADFENLRAANSIGQKQQRISKNNPNLEHDPVRRQGSWKRTKASSLNSRKDDYRHAILIILDWQYWPIIFHENSSISNRVRIRYFMASKVNWMTKIFGKKYVKKKQLYERVKSEIHRALIGVIINKSFISTQFFSKKFCILTHFHCHFHSYQLSIRCIFWSFFDSFLANKNVSTLKWNTQTECLSSCEWELVISLKFVCHCLNSNSFLRSSYLAL